MRAELIMKAAKDFLHWAEKHGGGEPAEIATWQAGQYFEQFSPTTSIASCYARLSTSVMAGASLPTLSWEQRMIRIGTAGWQYRDWAGIVYPKPRPRGFDDLSFIAGFFDTVEINSSFYGPPRRRAAETWAERVSGNPRFRFTAKLWKGFTHERNATADEERLFKDGLEPLVESGRFGALLAQFPWSYRNETENRMYLRRLRNRFVQYPLVLEVRHGSWIEPDVLDELAESGIGLCNIDQPLFRRSVKPTAPRYLCHRLRSAARTQLPAVVLQNGRRARALRLPLFGA